MKFTPKHVVMFSGGLGSWATAKRVAAEHGTSEMVLLFADVKGKSTNPHVGEDEDTYRFIKEAAANVGAPLFTLNEGRDIWQVFKDDRFLGNSRLANCSKFLKQIPCRKWIDDNCDPKVTTIYVGIDWSEVHRMEAITKNYLPFVAKAPMTEAPFLEREDMQKWCLAEGIAIPRLYKEGYAHNNCGGGCVRSGQGQFAKLMDENPERYEEWAKREQEIRDHLGKDVAILRDRTGGTSTPMTLVEFRDRRNAKTIKVLESEIGGCGCFVDDYEQGRLFEEIA